MISVNLYNSVIYCQDLEKSRIFYELIGFILTWEQHGSGPVHYSFRADKKNSDDSDEDKLLYELYPTQTQKKSRRQTFLINNPCLWRMIRNDRLPLVLVDQVRSRWDPYNNRYNAHVLDPDGNRVIIRNKTQE